MILDNLTLKKRIAATISIFFITIIAMTLLFKLPIVAECFSAESLNSTTGILLWTFVWIIIFLECGIIPGSYLPFLIFFSQTSLAADKWFFIGFVTSAVLCGRFLAYFVGKKFAGNLLHWALGDKYLSITSIFNSNGGKFIYAVTVAAPGFPDFILALLAGAIEMNFTFYIITNFVCKLVENILIVLFSLTTAEKSIWIYVYIILVSLSSIYWIYLTIKSKRRIFNND